VTDNSYLVPERKLENFFKFKEGENFDHRNTLKYFEDQNLSLTQKLEKLAVFVQALSKIPLCGRRTEFPR